jgi:serine/threonine-protein kinase
LRKGVVIGALVVGLIGLMAAVDVSQRSTRVNPQSPTGSQSPDESTMAWQPSCGSSDGNALSWWPVLGPREALDLVRSRYCGDAYATADGATQVASFTSVGAATDFAMRLSAFTGYSFRVGQQRIP